MESRIVVVKAKELSNLVAKEMEMKLAVQILRPFFEVTVDISSKIKHFAFGIRGIMLETVPVHR